MYLQCTVNHFINATTLKCIFLMLPTMLVWCLIQFTQHSTIRGHGNYLHISNNKQLNDLILHKRSAIYPSNQKIVCVSFKGRLGNMMFQYASAYGIARRKNATLRISVHDNIAKVFQVTAQTVSNKFYCPYADKKFEEKHCAYDPKMVNITSKMTMLFDYLQSWVYFQQYENEIRREFKFNTTISDSASKIFSKLKEKSKYFGYNTTYVGVHIRRGDMFYAQIKNKTKVAGYNIAPRSYIDKALKYFKRNYENVTFVFCSEDIRWSMWQYGRYQRLLNIVFVHQDAEVDLAVLAMCNHTIMTTGTFGWWAGWLAGGETVYYKHYVKEDSYLRQQFSDDFSDYYLPGWIAME